ncbi:MAG TPA: lamin tail domain-containing protein [Verrucomicrobiae bacterium]|nr:lamin tail domain-containing protein [Verrucomicrobiae bacterium]
MKTKSCIHKFYSIIFGLAMAGVLLTGAPSVRAQATPSISNISPDGSIQFQPSNTLTFTAASSAGIAASSITVQLNGTTLSGETFSTTLDSASGLSVGGTSTSRSVSAPLTSNIVYTAIIQATDANENTTTATVNFDTIKPAYTFEAEDFDYSGGQYHDNPQTNAYKNLNATEGIDTHNNNFGGGGSAYRPSGLNTENASDKPRLAYTSGAQDYDVGWNNGGSGNWGNYTRTFPSGAYNIYMRAAYINSGGVTADSASMSLVTSGQKTSTQTTTNLGTFSVPGTGNWQAYTWVPLRDTNGYLVQFTGGGVKTLRVTTDNGNYNANFYLLMPADVSLPVIANIFPDGSSFFQYTNTFSFTASSTAGITTNSIVVTLDGTNVSNLIFSGSLTSWNVSCPVSPDSSHTVMIKVTALNGNVATTTVNFNDFQSTYYQWEAEDYDYTSNGIGGLFFDNPQTNAYAGLPSLSNVDNHQFDLNANPFLYRTNTAGSCPSTTVAGDGQRPQYASGKIDYNIGFFGGGSWVNYTRHYPAGTYYVWGRFAEGSTNTEATLSQLVSGYATTSQTVNPIGTFFIPYSGGWNTWEWALLEDNNGNPVKVQFDGSRNTVQLGGSQVGGQPEVNVNFLMLVPTTPDIFTVLQALNNGTTNVQISYSKPVEPASATNIANYVFTNGLQVIGASLSADGQTVTLTTAPMTYGVNYSIVINNVRDQMNLPNTIAPNTTVTFQALPYTLQNIGNPPVLSTIVGTGNGLNLAASGSDTGGTSDQGGFSYQLVSGDFDVATRVSGLDLSDIFAKAGWMARESLATNSRYAASLTTPTMNGSFFSWRNPAGSAANTAGNFPPNYPNTWLRLKRSGNTFSGFAGYDGQTWTQLGSATIAMSNQVYLGFSVSSHGTNVTTAQFRDIVTNVIGAVVGTAVTPHEAIGPCSRTTPIVFSEIMYKPASRTDGKNLEFIELYNSNPWFQDISGYQISCADMSYTFPPNTTIPGGGYLVVAPAPADIESVYGITNVMGPYSGSLKKSETLQLLDEQGAVLLTVPYSAASPWPVGAAGEGHSIILANPTYGEGDPRAWSISDVVGGSPGQMDAFRPSPLRNVVINEFLAHTDLPDVDYIELYNHSTNSVDISGCILTDNASTNKFVVPNGTVMLPGGFVSYTENDMGFGLDAAGETIYFINPDHSRILDAVNFGPQQNGVATGRWPDGANDFYRLSAKTPGAGNAPILLSDVVFNELMYDPISGNDDDQYIELYNRSTNTIDLSGWQLAGGVTFTIPNGTTLASGGYLVVARNETNLFSKYPNLNAGNTVGNYSGKLSHNGEYIALTMPVVHNGTNINVTVNDLTYGTGGRWGEWSHAGGSSLELIDPNSNNRLAANWADSDETSKSVWTNIETTGVLDNGANHDSSIGYAQIGLLDSGECLVDNVEVDYNGVNYVSNPDFENGTNGWTFQGCMARSSLENTGYNGSSYSLHIRSSDHVWTGDNSCQVSLNNTSLQSGQTATLRFKARWLRGWPEALLRLNGNWLEAAGALPVPSNLGSPGQPNSRAIADAGPAIYNVTHTPSLPAANQPVVVTANAHAPNGLQNLTLYYRLDPSTSYTAVPMKDDGTGGDAIAGDGVFSATIPGQAANQIAAFYISATDSLSVATRFPAVRSGDNEPIREGVVMFGDSNPGGSFGVYHLWITQTNATRWANLGNLSNEGNDCTIVVGSRVMYNAQARFAGSPYHQNFTTPNGALCHYKWTFNDDDQFLGATSFNKIHQPGNGAGDDASLQREQLANTFLRALGVPWLNRRYVVVYVNGNRRGDLMEDTQCPDADMVKEHFPSDSDGFLYKMQPWFEFAPFLNGESMDFDNQSWCTLNNYTTTGGAKKVARYRYNYLVRRTPDSASNYTNVFALVDAANTYGSSNYVANIENIADMENWMRVFAANHAAGNWDSFGAQNGQNLYGYIGTQGTKYSLLMFDFNIVLGNSGSWSPGQNLFTTDSSNPWMGDIYNTPVFRRMYWRALDELVNGPLNVANSGPLLDTKYQVFNENGLTGVEDPNTNIKGWLTQARSSIASQLAAENATGFTVNPPIVSNGIAQISGIAPVDAQTIWFNGVSYPLTWTTVTHWTASVPVPFGTNQLSVVGVDSHGNAIPGDTGNFTVTNTVNGSAPQPNVVINEWMADNKHTLANPVGGGFDDWFELYNPATNAVDLGGYFLTDKLTSKFESGIPANGHYVIQPRSFLLVWADNNTNGNSLSQPDLHAQFALSKSGEAIGLFKPDGTAVDTVTFGAQTTDVSQGRYPDGNTNAANIVFMTVPTPGTNNIYNTAPVLAAISNAVLTLGQTLTFTASATDADLPPQTLTFSLGAGAPSGATITAAGQFSWTPTLAPATNTISIVVTDNGTPPASATRSFTVTVWPEPQLGAVNAINNQMILSWQTVAGQNYQIEYKDNLSDADWTPLGNSLLGDGGLISITNDTATAQRFFRIRLQ